MKSIKRVLKIYNIKPIKHQLYYAIAIAKIKKESQFSDPIKYVIVKIKKDITTERLILKLNTKIPFDVPKNYLEMTNYNSQVDMLSHIDEVKLTPFENSFNNLAKAKKAFKKMSEEFLEEKEPHQEWDFIEYIESTGFKNV